MKKTLIIITHPDIENSVINKLWLQELEKYHEKFYIHQLHKVYPDQKFDIAAEQKLVEVKRLLFYARFKSILMKLKSSRL